MTQTVIGPKATFLDFLHLDGYPTLGLVGFLVAGLLGLRLAWSIFRSGRI